LQQIGITPDQVEALQKANVIKLAPE
jgi:hypothetical protein